MNKLNESLKHLSICSEAVDWLESCDSKKDAWESCSRSDWMLWLLGHTQGGPFCDSRRDIVLAACACAGTAPCGNRSERDSCQKRLTSVKSWAMGVIDSDRLVEFNNDLYEDAPRETPCSHADHASRQVLHMCTCQEGALHIFAFGSALHTSLAYSMVGSGYSQMDSLRRCAVIVREFFPSHPDVSGMESPRGGCGLGVGVAIDHLRSEQSVFGI